MPSSEVGGAGSVRCLVVGAAIGRDSGGVEEVGGGFAAAAARFSAHAFLAPDTTGAGLVGVTEVVEGEDEEEGEEVAKVAKVEEDEEVEVEVEADLLASLEKRSVLINSTRTSMLTRLVFVSSLAKSFQVPETRTCG